MTWRGRGVTWPRVDPFKDCGEGGLFAENAPGGGPRGGGFVEALKLDLVGPWAGHPLAEERLQGWVRPSNWYLTGFLIPSGTPPEKSADADENDDFELVPESAGLAEESNEERKAAKKGF